jgi:hypothetical protein
VEGRVVENGVGRRDKGPLSSCFCLLSTCQGGAFICSLTDCQGEMWLSLPPKPRLCSGKEGPIYNPG